MIILKHRSTNQQVHWPDGQEYSGREWEAVGSTTTQELSEMEKAFENEGLLLGDAIAKATSTIGFTPCPGCTRRQEWLNEWHKRGKDFVRELVTKLK